MDTVPLPNKTHPMIIVAAVSVTALSLTGIAALAGWLPVHGSAAAPAPVTASAEATPVPVPAPAVAAAKSEAPATLQIPAGSKITVEPKHAATVRHSPAKTAAAPHNAPARDDSVSDRTNDSAPRATRVAAQTVNDNGIYVENSRPQAARQPAPATCNDCGTVESVREIAGKGEGTGLGAVAGGVLGAILGNQIGGGNGKKVMAVAGAAGGAFAGHEVEKRMRGETQYEVTVRFDDGRTRTYTETQPTQLQDGDRVRLENGHPVML